MQIQELEKSKTLIEKLSIHSYEMNIYLVEILSEPYQGLVRNEKGEPQRFHSVQEVKDMFANCNVKFAELIHESPYDEMIGNPPKSNDRMVLPVLMR